MPFVSEKTAELAMDAIEFASDGTWPEFKDFLLERTRPKDINKAGEELANASSRDNPFEGEFE
jgi:hypothetical protein